MVSFTVNTVLKLTLVLVLITSITPKSISKSSEVLENEVGNDKDTNEKELVLKTQNEESNKFEKIVDKRKENIDEKISEKSSANGKEDEVKAANENEGRQDLDSLDPTVSINTGDNPRSSRTIGRLREVETPSALLENFRNKLQTARSNLEESIAARKAAEPRLFIFDPTAEKIKPLIPKPTVAALPTSRTTQESLNPVEKKEESKTVVSPILDDNSSSSEEHNTTEGNPSKLRSQENSEDINHLLHVRDEITKIRHMMQALREQQLQQQFGAQFPHTRNLTDDETKNLATIIEKLKDQGKISTNPLNEEEDFDFQNHPPETTKLIEDIKKLKESVISFAKQVGGPKGTVGGIEDLEKQIQQQRQEIESLKKLVDDLQPPKHFPSNPLVIKHPQNVKTDLHQELRTLQDILNALLKLEEKKERTEMANQGRMRSVKPEEELNTLMKIFHSMAHSALQGRQAPSIETKLEKLERDLKDLETQNLRTRHEILLQKLEHDVHSIKSSKSNPQGGLHASNSRGFNIPGSIDQELDSLQRELDFLAKKNLQKSKVGDIKTSRQLNNLFSDILRPTSFEPTVNIDKLKGISKHPKKIEVFEDIHEEVHPVLPSVVLEHTTKKENSHSPIFQLPFCLQKYHPYPSSIPVHPVGVEDISVHPIGVDEHLPVHHVEVEHIPAHSVEIEISEHQDPVKPSNAYTSPAKPQGYKPPSKHEQEPIKSSKYPSEYSHGYKQPIKIEEPTKPEYGYKEEQPNKYTQKDHHPIKIQKEGSNYGQKYEEHKPIIHHVYQHSLPKATPIKIQYQPETEDNQYGYQGEDIQYQPLPYKQPYHSEANINEEINHLNGVIGGLDEKIDYSQAYDGYRSKNYKPRKKRSLDEDNDKILLYKEIQQRLATLREAVENVEDDQDNQEFTNDLENEINSDFQRSAYTPDSYQPYDNKNAYASKFKKLQKFDKLFIKVVKFILHKIEISAPFVVEALFDGDAFELVPDTDHSYKYKNARSAPEEEEDFLFKNGATTQRGFGGLFDNFEGFHGLLGFIPTILFKLLSNFSSFLNMLKQNTFFKNFIFPGALILGVDGIMALLVWWFSTDENHNILNLNTTNFVN